MLGSSSPPVPSGHPVHWLLERAHGQLAQLGGLVCWAYALPGTRTDSHGNTRVKRVNYHALRHLHCPSPPAPAWAWDALGGPSGWLVCTVLHLLRDTPSVSSTASSLCWCRTRVPVFTCVPFLMRPHFIRWGGAGVGSAGSPQAGAGVSCGLLLLCCQRGRPCHQSASR